MKNLYIVLAIVAAVIICGLDAQKCSKLDCPERNLKNGICTPTPGGNMTKGSCRNATDVCMMDSRLRQAFCYGPRDQAGDRCINGTMPCMGPHLTCVFPPAALKIGADSRCHCDLFNGGNRSAPIVLHRPSGACLPMNAYDRMFYTARNSRCSGANDLVKASFLFSSATLGLVLFYWLGASDL